MTQPLNAILRSGGNINDPNDIIKEMLLQPRDNWVIWLFNRMPGADVNISYVLDMIREGERLLAL